MRCTCYRTDPTLLLGALTDNAFIERWLAATQDELASLADKRLADHVRAMQRIAGYLMAESVEVVAERDRAALDAWLTDALAVATWHAWDLPLEPLGERELSIDALPRGLLGADRAKEGAGLWLIEDDVIAMARWRETPTDAPAVAGEQAPSP